MLLARTLHPLHLYSPNPTCPRPSSAHLPHLQDHLRFGDNLEDEWFAVFLLFRLSLRFPSLSFRLWDSDDDFLLIEAAFHLPRWLNPDTSLHHLFLHNGTLRIVLKSLPNPSLLDSLSFISSSQSLASDPIQRAIQNCIRDYPHRARRNMYRVRVKVPVSVAHLLRHEPWLISLAVEAFYDRDVDTMKFAGVMERFLERGKAEELVRVSVTMSRAMYAQLVQRQFQAPKCYPEMPGCLLSVSLPPHSPHSGIKLLSLHLIAYGSLSSHFRHSCSRSVLSFCLRFLQSSLVPCDSVVLSNVRDFKIWRARGRLNVIRRFIRPPLRLRRRRPSSLLQYGFQDLSDRKLCISRGDCSDAIENSVFPSVGRGTFQTSGVGLITENLISHNLQICVNTYSEVSSRGMVGLNNSSNFVFHDIQRTNAATLPTVPGDEKSRESLSSPVGVIVCSAWEKVAIFFSAIQGFLVLFAHAIVATCQFLNFVSIQDYMELTPGEAVYVESGETISQWKKLYFLRKGILSTACSSLETATNLLKDHDCIIKQSAKDGVVGRDAASSNVHLRLGQPPQTGNPLPSFTEPLLVNALASHPKLQPLKQMFNNVKPFDNVLCTLHADLSREESYMCAVSNAPGAARARSETNSVAKFGFTNVPWNNNGHTGRQSNYCVIGTDSYLGNPKDSCAKMNSEFGIGQSMEYLSSITRALGDSDVCVVNTKIHESSLPSDSYVGANILHHSNNVSAFGRENHVTPQTSIPFEEVLKGLPNHVSSSVSNQTATLPQQQDIDMDAHLLDGNMRLLTLAQGLELSKQRHVVYLDHVNKEQGRPSSISKVQIICMNMYCHLSGLAPRPSHSKEKKSQYQKPGFRILFLGINKDNNRSSECEKCSQHPSNICLGGKHPDLSRDLNAWKDKNIHSPLEQVGKLDGQDSIKIGFHTPRWRDVPGQDGVQHGNISMKRFKSTIDMGDMPKEKESSSVSYGCYAPVVTGASVRVVNKVDSCTGDAVSTGFFNKPVVDEGSRIYQGLSSDLVESERSDELLGLTYSSIWNKGMNQSLVFSANCKSNQSKKFKGFKGKKRKRIEMRILDASLSSGFPSLLHKRNGEGAGISNSSSSLSKEIQMHSLSCLQQLSDKSSFVQPCNKQRHSAFPSKFLPCKNHLNQNNSYKVGFELESNSDARFHTLPGVSGTEKLKKDPTSDCFELFQMQEPVYEEPEDQRPFSCREKNAHRITRPVVCGKYGELSNGQLARGLQKPAKIVPLSKILKHSKRCMGLPNGKPKLTSKKKWKRLGIGNSSGNPGLEIEEDNKT
ncbi:hypothetical protein Fmac_031926 [Flemingia macrophylla]|uniref:Cyclic nucleotide-binding domain-containing protein n=1 Tax=Flemingia macrophylla TaxID=520843 RepID=A0ABD1L4S7_9FABA